MGRRYNPNWGKATSLNYLPNNPSSFDAVVKELGLSVAEYEKSSELREWVRKYKDEKYVPPELLTAWDFGVAEKSLTRRKKSINVQLRENQIKVDCDRETRKVPSLEVVNGSSPLRGCCSACVGAAFQSDSEMTSQNQQRQRLKYLFNRHYLETHLQQEDC
jgi:hypothetical protein